MSDFLPRREAELVTWSSNFATRISATPVTYGLTEPQALQFNTVNNQWTQAYTVAKNGLTRSPANIQTKDQAKTDMVALARELAGIIQKYPGTTNAMREELGLTVAKPHSPVPPPSVRPGMDLVGVSGRNVTVHIHDSASSAKRGKPAGAVSAWVYTFVGETYPSDPSAWQFQGGYNTAEVQISFPETVPTGSQVWVCAAWINRRSEAGPVSVPISTYLQMGGVNSPTQMKLAA